MISVSPFPETTKCCPAKHPDPDCAFPTPSARYVAAIAWDSDDVLELQLVEVLKSCQIQTGFVASIDDR